MRRDHHQPGNPGRRRGEALRADRIPVWLGGLATLPPGPDRSTGSAHLADGPRPASAVRVVGHPTRSNDRARMALTAAARRYGLSFRAWTVSPGSSGQLHAHVAGPGNSTRSRSSGPTAGCSCPSRRRGRSRHSVPSATRRSRSRPTRETACGQLWQAAHAGSAPCQSSARFIWLGVHPLAERADLRQLSAGSHDLAQAVIDLALDLVHARIIDPVRPSTCSEAAPPPPPRQHRPSAHDIWRLMALADESNAGRRAAPPSLSLIRYPKPTLARPT